MNDDTNSETRWMVRQSDPFDVDVVQVTWERDTCSHGLYATEQEAWEVARDRAGRHLGDCHEFMRWVVEDAQRRVDRAESVFRFASEMVRRDHEPADA